MKIIFFGSDEFAVVNLDALLNAGHEICACVTAPDKPKGRGMHLAASPVKEFAAKHKIPVLQPAVLREERFLEKLRSLAADLFVVIAYGKILPPEVLEIPKICAVNCHASLLPKYRGAAPINWAIMNGETETGISIIKLNPVMDAGDILAQTSLCMDPQDTAITLRARLAELSAKTLLATVTALSQGACPVTAQKKADVTFAPKLKKEIGLIDWRKSAEEIHNLARGLLPWPTAYTYLNGKLLKILEAEAVSTAASGQGGMILEASAHRLVVATGKAGLWIKKVLPESGKPMLAADFIHGHKVQSGMRLGK